MRTGGEMPAQRFSIVTFSICPLNPNGGLYSWLTGVPVLRPMRRP